MTEEKNVKKSMTEEILEWEAEMLEKLRNMKPEDLKMSEEERRILYDFLDAYAKYVTVVALQLRMIALATVILKDALSILKKLKVHQ